MELLHFFVWEAAGFMDKNMRDMFLSIKPAEMGGGTISPIIYYHRS